MTEKSYFMKQMVQSGSLQLNSSYKKLNCGITCRLFAVLLDCTKVELGMTLLQCVNV